MSPVVFAVALGAAAAGLEKSDILFLARLQRVPRTQDCKVSCGSDFK